MNPMDRLLEIVGRASELSSQKGAQDMRSFLVESLGVAVQGFPLENSGWKAALIPVNGTPTVFYNNSLPLSEQEASLAHELGHHVLGHIPSVSPQHNRADMQNLEAEVFALAFCLCQERPNDEIHKFLEENPELAQLMYVGASLGLAGLVLVGVFGIARKLLK